MLSMCDRTANGRVALAVGRGYHRVLLAGHLCKLCGWQPRPGSWPISSQQLSVVGFMHAPVPLVGLCFSKRNEESQFRNRKRQKFPFECGPTPRHKVPHLRFCCSVCATHHVCQRVPAVVLVRGICLVHIFQNYERTVCTIKYHHGGATFVSYPSDFSSLCRQYGAPCH
ncbi:hypothetical protein BR93DRAFT_283811 [Coniochaeta sp. PMI_546]|nr:hypothetical protein BR93DRAFT_283811 [Coniochaeta sp. PMI_546]